MCDCARPTICGETIPTSRVFASSMSARKPESRTLTWQYPRTLDFSDLAAGRGLHVHADFCAHQRRSFGRTSRLRRISARRRSPSTTVTERSVASKTRSMRDAQFGMGSALGDIDNDGDLDWFVTSIFGPGDEKIGLRPWGNRLLHERRRRRLSSTTPSDSASRTVPGVGGLASSISTTIPISIFITRTAGRSRSSATRCGKPRRPGRS